MVEIDLCHIKHQTEITAHDYARADLPPPRRSSSAAMAPDGGGGDGKPVEPHQGTVTPNKQAMKRKSEQCDRAESVSPDSTITTMAAAQPRDGDGGVDQQVVTTTAAAASSRGGDDGVEELQQQMNGKKPRLVWTTELHQKFVRACKNLGGREKVVPKNILKEMNIRGLTRENVASHLQKYRMNLQGKGPAVRKRGKAGGAPTTMMHRTAPSLQPVLTQAQPIESAFPQAPSPSPSANPPNPHQAGSFAAANMSHPQIGHGQRQVVQAPPTTTLVHQQPQENFPVVMPPQLLYPPPQLQAAMEQQRKMMMERHAQHAARITKQASVAPGHNRYMAPMNYELRAQMLTRAPASASGVQSHHLQPHMQGSQAVNMSGGLYCPVPQASTRDEHMETPMGVARLQITVEPEVGQAPAAEPAFPGSADPDNNNGGQQEDSCGILRFWNTTSAPSMDHEVPPKKPT